MLGFDYGRQCLHRHSTLYIMLFVHFVLVFSVMVHVTMGSGYPPKKVQIHVPHNIQHHHHTHTKYHFITVPVLRTLNETTTTARPMVLPVLPVMPMIPGLVPNLTTTTTPAPPPPPANPIPAMFFNRDYELIDMYNRRRGEKQATQQPPKFRTIINVQETKNIPLVELLSLNSLLQKEPTRRVKVEVIPEKPKPAAAVDWSSLRQDNFEYDSDTAAYQSRMETSPEKPEWFAVRQLLEKHIRQDFPGLNIQTEIKQIEPRKDTLDLKHIGYIVVDEHDKKHFVGLTEPISETTT